MRGWVPIGSFRLRQAASGALKRALRTQQPKTLALNAGQRAPNSRFEIRRPDRRSVAVIAVSGVHQLQSKLG